MLRSSAVPVPTPIALTRSADIAHPERALRRAEIVRVRGGVYADAGEWQALTPWNRYLARIHAVALDRPDAIFSHDSAAALHGMPVFGDPLVVHVLAHPSTTARQVAGVRVHNGDGDRDIVEAGGVVLTGVADTAASRATR
ncbi:hypothetical protein QL996_01885 [Planococcus sp. APC 4015]|nr:hypothetical protein [Planococcus sp. APC 4015]